MNNSRTVVIINVCWNMLRAVMWQRGVGKVCSWGGKDSQLVDLAVHWLRLMAYYLLGMIQPNHLFSKASHAANTAGG